MREIPCVAELTYKERLFVSAYIGEAKGNASEAARIAGYGTMKRSSGVLANRLLKKVKIRAAIHRRVSAVALTSDEVLARVAELATADIGDYIDINASGDYTVNLKRAKKQGLAETSGFGEPCCIAEGSNRQPFRSASLFSPIGLRLDPPHLPGEIPGNRRAK
jgi:hypothetical protein